MLTTIMFAVLAIGPLVVAVLAMALFQFIPTRLMLMLPAAAIGPAYLHPRHAWRQSRGNFWRLFFGYMLVTVPALLIALVPVLYGEASNRYIYVGQSVLTELLLVVGGLFGVSFLSLAYLHFFGGAPETAADAK